MNIINIDSGGGRTLTDTASGEVTLAPSRTLKTENPPRWPLSRHRAFGMIGALHSGVHRSGEGDDAEMVIGEAPTLSFSKSRVAASEEARRSARAKEEFSMIGALSRTYSKRVKKPRGPEMVRPRFPILDKKFFIFFFLFISLFTRRVSLSLSMPYCYLFLILCVLPVLLSNTV